MKKEKKILGLDLDGVIINQTPLKIKLAAERGYHLTPEQTPSDVIRSFLPPSVMREVERERYANPKVVLSASLMRGARKNLFRIKESGLPFYLITRRDFPELVVKLLKKRRLWPEIFDEKNTFFVERLEDKDAVAERIGLTHYVDDRVTVLDRMPSVAHRILFDQWGVFAEVERYPSFSTWGDLADYLLGA